MKYDSGRQRRNLFRSKRRAPILPASLIVLALLVFFLALLSPPRLTAEMLQPIGVPIPSATPASTPQPHPTDIHGGHIVFTCTRQGINQICLINADGTGFKQLTGENTHSYYPAISPDGRAVVFANNQYDSFDLYLLDLQSGKRVQLTHNIGNAFGPDFSADGRQILFINKSGDAPAALWIMERTGENPRPLYAGPKDIVGAAWSPDSRTIAFAMSVDSPFVYEIFLLDVQNPKAPPRRITHGLSGIGGSVDWSPDGSNLLLYAGPVGAREIYRLDLATGTATRLTFGGNNAAAAYAPDGQWIVYNSLRNDNQADLYIMRADGHSTRRLTSDAQPDWQPKWGP